MSPGKWATVPYKTFSAGITLNWLLSSLQNADSLASKLSLTIIITFLVNIKYGTACLDRKKRKFRFFPSKQAVSRIALQSVMEFTVQFSVYQPVDGEN